MPASKAPPESTDLLELVNQVYPDWKGFEDPRFVEDERVYKVEAAENAQKSLSFEELGILRRTGMHAEVLSRVRQVAQSTNLLYLSTPRSGDLAVLEQEGLPIEAASKLISDLLHGTDWTRRRLDRYREILVEARLRPSWPLPTYLLFLMNPEEEVFIKPSVVRWLEQKRMTIGVSPLPKLFYDATVNGGTYEEVQQFYRVVGDFLREMGYPPRDMIDVQSFLFVTFSASQGNVEKSSAADESSESEDESDTPISSELEEGSPREERVPVHPDSPAVEDRLGRWPFANILARRIREIYENPAGPATFAVHLHGPWGSGKTSVLNFLRKELQDSEPPWLVVDFNAWKHQRMRPPWWPLIREVYDQSMDQLSGFVRWRPRLRWWWWRLKTSWLPALLTLVTLGLMVTFFVFLSGDEGSAFEIKEAVTLLLAVLSLGATVRTLHQSVLHGSAKAAQDYMELQSDPLSSLSRLFRDLTTSFRRPLAIFVDDLDRCDDDYVVDLLEGIQTLFRDASVVYVVAADRDWIQTSFERRYTDFLVQGDGSGRPLGHLFLQKMFQVSVGLPRLSEEAKQAYWQSLIMKGEPSLDVAEQEKMAEEGAEILQEAVNPQEIQRVVERHKNTPEEAGVRIAAAQRLSTPEGVDATEHFLLSYVELLEPNPRSMKRLVNAFGLAQSVNLLSHVDVPLESLARWTILRQRWPQLADLLAKHPALLEAFEGDEEPVDPRIPNELKRLFTQPVVRRVVSGNEGVEDQLEEEALRRLVGY